MAMPRLRCVLTRHATDSGLKGRAISSPACRQQSDFAVRCASREATISPLAAIAASHAVFGGGHKLRIAERQVARIKRPGRATITTKELKQQRNAPKIAYG